MTSPHRTPSNHREPQNSAGRVHRPNINSVPSPFLFFSATTPSTILQSTFTYELPQLFPLHNIFFSFPLFYHFHRSVVFPPRKPRSTTSIFRLFRRALFFLRQKITISTESTAAPDVANPYGKSCFPALPIFTLWLATRGSLPFLRM